MVHSVTTELLDFKDLVKHFFKKKNFTLELLAASIEIELVTCLCQNAAVGRNLRWPQLWRVCVLNAVLIVVAAW
jgi:hypothetical protein